MYLLISKGMKCCQSLLEYCLSYLMYSLYSCRNVWNPVVKTSIKAPRYYFVRAEAGPAVSKFLICHPHPAFVKYFVFSSSIPFSADIYV